MIITKGDVGTRIYFPTVDDFCGEILKNRPIPRMKPVPPGKHDLLLVTREGDERKFEIQLTSGENFFDVSEGKLVEITWSPGHSPGLHSTQDESLIALENEGQQLILKYLKGGSFNFTAEEFRHGAEIFARAAELAPDDPKLKARQFFCEGFLLIYQRKYSEAVNKFKEAIRLDPTGAYSYDALGYALGWVNIEEAEAAFKRASELAPRWSYPHLNLGILYAMRGNQLKRDQPTLARELYEKAEVEIRGSVERDPENALTHYNLAKLHHLSLEKYQEAEAEYKRAIELDSQLALAHAGIGDLFERQGKNREAAQERKIAQDLAVTLSKPVPPNPFEGTVASTQQAEVITNQTIIDLVKGKLSDNLIAEIIQESTKTKFDISAKAVLTLKRAGVSDATIQVMMAKEAGQLNPSADIIASSPPPPASAPIGLPTKIGVYVKKDNRWVEVQPEVVNWKMGGVLKAAARIVRGDVNGRINGPHSRNDVKGPVELLIVAPEGVAITEYQLLRLREQKDAREFRTVTGGVVHSSGGAKRDLVPFQGKKIAPRTFTVMIEGFASGEYGFLPPDAVKSTSATSSLGKMYTFRVTQEEQK